MFGKISALFSIFALVHGGNLNGYQGHGFGAQGFGQFPGQGAAFGGQGQAISSVSQYSVVSPNSNYHNSQGYGGLGGQLSNYATSPLGGYAQGAAANYGLGYGAPVAGYGSSALGQGYPGHGYNGAALGFGANNAW